MRYLFPFKEIKNILIKYSSKYNALTLTGGETTIRKDFFKILELAHRLGYKIQLETNAKLFQRKNFAKRIVKYNMDIVTHIESHKPRIHDLLSGTPGSFNNTIEGIKNLRRYAKNIVSKIILTKFNYKHLEETVNFIAGLKVDCILFIFLSPYGYADYYFDKLVPAYPEVAPYVKQAVIRCKKKYKMDVILESFPYCCVAPAIRDCIFEVPMGKESILLGTNSSFSNAQPANILNMRVSMKQKFSKCQPCRFYRICEGAHKKYVEIRGSMEFSPIKKV